MFGDFFFFRRVVEFASYSDLKNAIEKLSGKEINGRKIKLIEGSKRHRYGFLRCCIMLRHGVRSFGGSGLAAEVQSSALPGPSPVGWLSCRSLFPQQVQEPLPVPQQELLRVPQPLALPQPQVLQQVTQQEPQQVTVTQQVSTAKQEPEACFFQQIQISIIRGSAEVQIKVQIC